jgi:hypothetical protein
MSRSHGSALDFGELSGAQTAAVVDGATANPRTEQRLLGLAKHLSLKELRDDHKHRNGWALVEGTGKRPMVPPDDRRHPKNAPKRDTG